MPVDELPTAHGKALLDALSEQAELG